VSTVAARGRSHWCVFISGGERYERRTLEYRVGDERAVPVPLEVGDFYGMAAS
jgi:hypothetical protein